MQHRMDGLVAMVQSESEPRMNVAPPMSTVTPTITSTAAQQTQRPLTQTPLASKPPAIPAPPRRKWNVRPRISIPPDLTSHEYARQCVEAAEHSRLNPFALHPDEYELLRSHLTYAQTTTYLNLRNAILRLWVRNPRVAVTRDEALGCAKDARWLDAAHVAFQWLVRRGYINYGCVEVRPLSRRQKREYPLRNRRTVVVVGAGMSGLGCARQLEALFRQHAHEFELMGEDVPKVIVLEGRARVGGRVYSKAFRTKPEDLVDRRDDGRDAGPPRVPRGFEGKRFTAEMGGMIITGFERGNPMNILVRGQLGLAYHALRSETTLYDVDGKPVDARKDFLVESLYNDILDRVSVYKHKLTPPKLIEGNKDLILEGRDPSAEGIKTIAQVEEAMAAQPHAPPVSKLNLAPQPDLTTVSTNKMTGRPHVEPGTPALMGARDKARSIGWDLKEGLSSDGDGDGDVDLLAASRAPGATLGSVVDEAVAQYLRKVVELTPVDFRLLNWHVANLEYSNAIGLDQLSLALWDVDAGNEWEGKHTMVVGGYQSVPRGLMLCPTPLDVRTRAPVSRICYTMTSEDVEGASSGAGNGPTARKKAMVECEDGTSIEADFVVSTVPLGVLKNGGVAFDPPLPSWKAGAIERMGFGVLNKVVLVYKKAFWDESRDIFGTLRSGDVSGSLDQADYKRRRGRFFQWLNVSKTSGLPVLIALMAGYAGFDTEQETDEDLISEATAVLRRVFGRDRVPARPVESLVTRWRSDRFAQGSYSSAGPEMQPDDYDVMARPVGENLFFAGEHTCGTHPATVHGAYLSGLRAASEVFEAMVGPIHVPEPLILPKSEAAAADMDVSGEGVSVTGSGNHLKRKLQQETIAAEDQRAKRRAALELELNAHVVSVLGDRPPPPHRGAGNAYLIFSKDHFEEARKLCEEARRGGPGGGGGSNSSNAKNDVGRTGDVATAATNDSSQTPSEASVAGSPGPSVAATTIRNASPSNGGSSSGKTTPSHHNRNHHHHNRPVGPNDVRLMTSRMWRALTPAAKQPYEQRASEVRAAGRRAMEEWRVAVAEWERRAAEERAKWIAALDPAVANDLGIGGRAGGTGGLANGDGAGVGAIGSPATPSSGRRAARLARAVGSYAEDSDSDIDMYDA